MRGRKDELTERGGGGGEIERVRGGKDELTWQARFTQTMLDETSVDWPIEN